MSHKDSDVWQNDKQEVHYSTVSFILTLYVKCCHTSLISKGIVIYFSIEYYTSVANVFHYINLYNSLTNISNQKVALKKKNSSDVRVLWQSYFTIIDQHLVLLDVAWSLLRTQCAESQDTKQIQNTEQWVWVSSLQQYVK